MSKLLLLAVFLIGFGQVGLGQIAKQDFDGGTPTWSYSEYPTTYTTGSDDWAVLSSNSDPSGTTGDFWAMQDLDNPNGGGNFEHTLTFSGINISGYTGVTVEFDYYTKGFDGTDYLKYEIYQGTSGSETGQGEVSLNKNTNAWTNVSISIPNTENSVYIKIIAYQNGGSDYAGVDNFKVLGTAASTPDITLSSADPAVAAADVQQGTPKHAIYKFTTAVATADAELNSVAFTTTNSAAADITKYQLWYNTADNFGAASQLGTDITTSLGSGTHTFGSLSQSISSGGTGYFWITVDVASSATVNNTLSVSSAITTSQLTFASGNKSGTAHVGGLQTIKAGSPLISISPSSLTGFNYVETQGASAEQSYTVEGSFLTADITVTPPANWEIATVSGGPYQTSAITLTQSGGNVASTTIYTRMVSGLLHANSPFSGNITNVSTGATTKNVAVDGTVDALPAITLADNGTQVSVANVNSGTSNHILHKFSLAVANSEATLTGITVTTAGTYVSADITNLKVRYSTDATLDAGDATLSTLTTPGVAGNKTFPSFTSQAISSGSTGYIFITADIATGATEDNTISVNAVTTSQLTFSYGTKSGSTTNGGTQTIKAPAFIIIDDYDGTDDKTYTIEETGRWSIVSEEYRNDNSGNAPEHSYASYDLSNSLADFELDKARGNQWCGWMDFNNSSVSGWAASNNSIGMVLAANSNDFNNTGVEGYAVVYSNNSDHLELIKFNDGIHAGQTSIPENSTSIIATSYAFNSSATGLSFFVEYLSDGKWKIYWIEGKLSPTNAQNKANYTGGNQTSSSADETYVGETYKYTGWLHAHSTSSSQYAYFDNLGAGITPLPTGDATITAGALSEPATIDPLHDSAGEEFPCFDFKLTDDNTDSDPLIFSSFEITQKTENDVADWTDVIASAKIVNDDNTAISYATITSNKLTFSGFNYANSSDLGYITANDDRTYTLYIYFKTDLGNEAAVIDGKNLVFELLKNNIVMEAGSSLFAANEKEDSGPTNNEVVVTGTTLAFTPQPSNTIVNDVMSPAIAVELVDANGNRDLGDNSTVVGLTSTGSLLAVADVTLSSGHALFGDIVHDIVESGLTLTLSDNSGTPLYLDVVSNTFDIIQGPQTLYYGSYETTSTDVWDYSWDFSSPTGKSWEEYSYQGNSWEPTAAHDGNQYLWFNGYNESDVKDWAISPSYNFADYSNVYMDIWYWNYANSHYYPQILVSTDYVTGNDPTNTSYHWTDITPWNSASTFTLKTWIELSNLSLTNYDDEPNVHIAFYYEGPSSMNNNWAFDDYQIIGDVACGNPTLSAKDVTFDDLSPTQIRINFTEGNGEGRIVVVKQGSAVSNDPTDGTTYAANSVFGSGQELVATSGEYVVYNGPGNTVTVTGLTANTDYYFAIFEYNDCSIRKYRMLEATGNQTTPASGPEIDVKQAGTSYWHGTTFDFGDVEIGTNSDVNFTLENLGDQNLTFTGGLSLVGSTYSIQDDVSSPIVGGANDPFTIRFNPTSLGVKTGSMSIVNHNDNTDNGDGDEDPYTVYFTGKCVPSAQSDIVAITDDGVFDEPDNIHYENFQSTDIINDGNDVEVAQFNIRDGGSGTDGDAFATELAEISFDVLNWENIRRVAIYDGTTELGEVDAAANITFTGLSLSTGADGGNKLFSLRASFNSTVDDNERIQFTVTNAVVADGSSSFAATDAGGAYSSNGTDPNTDPDDNKIEVTASQIVWGTQPSDGETGVPLDAFTIIAVDANGNIDLDQGNTCSVTITSKNNGTTLSSPDITGTMTQDFSFGVATFNDIQYEIVQNSPLVTITGTASCWSSASSGASNGFKVIGIEPSNGDYRTILDDGSWHDRNPGTPSTVWEKYDGSTWVGASSNPGNGDKVFIRCQIETTNSNLTYNSMTIMNNGYFRLNTGNTETVTNMTIQDGGTLEIQNDFDILSTLTVEDGGTIIINTGDGDFALNNNFWQGTEKFYPNSNLIIKNWDYSLNDAVMPDNTTITPNTYNGYEAVFGNVIVDATTLGDQLALIEDGVTKNFAHGNIIIRNTTDGVNTYLVNVGDVTSGIGGDLIIENTVTSSDKFICKTSNGNLNFTIKGDITMDAGSDYSLTLGTASSTNTVINVEGDMTFNSGIFDIATTSSSSASYVINLDGNLFATNSSFQNTNKNGTVAFNFTGTSTQTVNITPIVKAIPMYIKNGASIELIGAHTQLGDPDNSPSDDSPMTIEAGGALQVNATKFYTQTGAIVNNAGTTGLIIQSTSSGTGSMIHNTGGIQATVQRYLTAGDWSFIFPSLSAVDGSVFSDGGYLYSYDESKDDYWGPTTIYGTTGWTAENSPNPMSDEKGYVLQSNAAQTYSTNGGVLNVNQKVFTVNYTSNSGSQGNGTSYIDETGLTKSMTNFDGWNLIGNPYPCAVDWSQVSLSNTDGFVYYFDGSNYQCFSAGSGAYLNQGITTNGGSQHIPVGQGVFVKAQSGGGTVTIPTTARVHNNQTFWKGADVIPKNIVKFNIEKDGFTDECIVRTLPAESGVTEEHDGNYDAFKMFSWDGSNPQIFTLNDDLSSDFAINSIPEFIDNKSVPLGVYVGTTGEYTINFTENSFKDMYVWIEDKEQNHNTVMTNLGSYTFVEQSGTNVNRFVLHFETKKSTILDNEDNSNNKIDFEAETHIYPNPSTGIVNISIPSVDEISTIKVVSVSGRTLLQTETNDELSQIDLSSFTNGIYFIEVTNSNATIMRKIILKQ